MSTNSSRNSKQYILRVRGEIKKIMSSKKQGNLHRMFTQPDLSKIELKSKVWESYLIKWQWVFIFLCSRYFKCGMTHFTLYFSSSMRSSEEYQLIVLSTQNFRTFIHSSNSSIIWKIYRLRCGILIRIGSYCLLIITIISGQHCSMLTKDYVLCYSDKVQYTRTRFD